MNELNQTEKRAIIAIIIFGLINLSPIIQNKEINIIYFIPLIIGIIIALTYLFAPKKFILPISIKTPPIETLSLSYFCKGRVRHVEDVTYKIITSTGASKEAYKNKIELQIRYSFTSPKQEHKTASTDYLIPKEDYELLKEKLKELKNKKINVRSNKNGSRSLPDLHYVDRYYLFTKTEKSK